MVSIATFGGHKVGDEVTLEDFNHQGESRGTFKGHVTSIQKNVDETIYIGLKVSDGKDTKGKIITIPGCRQ